MKNNKKVKYILSLASVLLIVAIGFTIKEYNTGNVEENSSNSSNVELVSNESESNSIENNVSTKIVVPESESESGKAIKAVDNDEISKRYDNVDKNTLTYKTTMEDSPESYFYEYDRGLALHREDNKDLKPINNKKYEKTLLGYTYSKTTDGFTRNDALDKVSLVLPDDSKIVEKREFDDNELIHYSSTQGNFIVYLGYQIEPNSNGEITDINKDKIVILSYFKEV